MVLTEMRSDINQQLFDFIFRKKQSGFDTLSTLCEIFVIEQEWINIICEELEPQIKWTINLSTCLIILD